MEKFDLPGGTRRFFIDEVRARVDDYFKATGRSVKADARMETDDRLRQCIVVRVASAAHGWLDAGFGEALGWAIAALVDDDVVGGITAHTLPMTIFFKSEIDAGLVEWDFDVDVDLGLLATLLLVDHQIDQLLSLSRIEQHEQRQIVIDAFREEIDLDVRTNEGYDLLEKVTEQLEQELGRTPTTEEVQTRMISELTSALMSFDERSLILKRIASSKNSMRPSRGWCGSILPRRE